MSEPTYNKTDAFIKAINILFPNDCNTQSRDTKLTQLLNNNPAIEAEIDNIIKTMVMTIYISQMQRALVKFYDEATVTEVLDMSHIQTEFKEFLLAQYKDNLQEIIKFPISREKLDENDIPIGIKMFSDMEQLSLIEQGNKVLTLLHNSMIDAIMMGILIGMEMNQ